MSEIIINVTRGDITENIHRGDIAFVDLDGKLVAGLGDTNKFTFMRSSAKPIQVSAVLESGAIDYFDINEKELAVMCGSHYAEDFHVLSVLSILHKIGLEEKYLRLGATYSLDQSVSNSYIKKGIEKKKVFNNCSGKHAGMLALAMKEGFDGASYDSLENPVQQNMLQTVAQYSGYDKEKIGIGVDGCGVPVFALPIYNMALSFARLANPEVFEEKREKAARRIVSAMTKYPEMIAGTNGFCSELMKTTKGRLVGKLGADGVYCIGVVGGKLGFAIKVEDGNMKAISCAVIEALKQMDLMTVQELESLKSFHVKDNINTLGIKVGEIKSNFELEIYR